MINEDDSELGEYFFMIEPLILEIYLNRQNYKDRLLINDLKKSARTIRLDLDSSSSFFVNAEEVKDILSTKWKKEIDNFDSTPRSALLTTSNSIFFIESVLRGFKRLRYFRIHVSDDEELAKSKINIDYKIMHSKIDFANNLMPEFFEKFKYIFKQIGVFNYNHLNPKPYIEVSVRDLFIKLQKFMSNFEEGDEEYESCLDIMDIFGPKLEQDNCTVLIIMQK
jgi:hypothetical protein